MAYKYQGDSILGVSLTVETPKPLDSRSVVDNIDELYSIPEKYAYLGMTVSNINDGNIYMLIDKSHISDKKGWKASYESIQIITCTQDEYKEWSANTSEDFRPIDGEKPYLRPDVYYYIYEDSLSPDTEDQEYLSASWGKQIEEQLKQKALNTTVVALQQQVQTDIENLKNNYITSEEIAQKYALQSSLNTADPESILSKALANYYTRKEADDKFVTIESLKGEGTEGDDFIFVTKNKYEEDQQKIQDELDKTLKTDGSGQLESITVKQIKSPIEEEEDQLVIDVKSDGLFVGEDQFAMMSDVPKLVCLPQTDYDDLVENNRTENDTYYCTYGEKDIQDTGYVRSEYLTERYYTKAEVEGLIKAAVDELQKKIDAIQPGNVQVDGENEQLIF